MNPTMQRSVEVDFLRGLVLMVIMLDHISGSTLSHFTLHAYAYCDAAEVFVFLGGYATAAAYVAIDRRGVPGSAGRRFLKRAWEIYRAYLLTAALMLMSGLVMLMLQVHPTLLPYTDAQQWLNRPARILFDIVTLRSQPYLASVLPMYALFALAAPLSVPFARSTPIGALLVSLVVWLFAQPLARMLPSADPTGWGFNPFAWQLMFVFGMLCRLHTVPRAFYSSVTGVRLTRLALALFLTFAFCKLVLQTQPEPGHWKQNLAAVRVISFASVGWLVAQAVRLGWLEYLARALPQVVRVGRQGLICFIVGALISVTLDTVLQVAALRPDTVGAYGAGLLGDAVAIVALLCVASLAQAVKAARRKPLAHAAGAVVRQPPA
jgi:hypothetical protein